MLAEENVYASQQEYEYVTNRSDTSLQIPTLVRVDLNHWAYFCEVEGE